MVDHGRRAFFRLGSEKVARKAVETLDRKVRKRAQRWLRPPYAIEETEFLLTCTRCSACIEACPESILFPLPFRLGADVGGTPAMDLTAGACALCEDWPCVNACEPRVLHRESGQEGEPIPLPRLSIIQIDQARCLPYSGPECGACGAICPVDGAMIWRDSRPVIDTRRCTGCAACYHACITDPPAISIHSPHALET